MLRLKPAMLSREEKCVQAVLVAAAVASCPILYNFVRREREREGEGGRGGFECGHCQGLDITSLFFHAGCLVPHYQQGYAVSCGDESSLD